MIGFLHNVFLTSTSLVGTFSNVDGFIGGWMKICWFLMSLFDWLCRKIVGLFDGMLVSF